MILGPKKALSFGLVAVGLCCLPPGTVAHGAPPAADEQTAGSRILAPGDTVQITVYQDPMLNTSQQISTDGTVEMFYIGAVPVKGITTEDAAARIAALLFKDKYIRNAQVRVSIVEYLKQVVTVKGQVNRPGPITLPTERPMDLLEAIASAGGETRAGDLSSVEVRRIKDGQTSTQKINLKELARQNQVFMVQPGDVITVGIRMF